MRHECPTNHTDSIPITVMVNWLTTIQSGR
jgi:hypothetical protein